MALLDISAHSTAQPHSKHATQTMGTKRFPVITTNNHMHACNLPPTTNNPQLATNSKNLQINS